MAESILMTDSLQLFFAEQLEEAGTRRGDKLAPHVEAYTANLLAEFARRPEAAGRTSAPLALEYLEAQQAGPVALRAVGDRALYIAGVVPASFDRAPVRISYVADIGRSAYHAVFDRRPSLGLFGELAETFARVAELMGCVAQPQTGDEDLLEVYERWREHRRPSDARRLREAGVVLADPGTDPGRDRVH